jgi:hypothetical protein
MGDVRFILQVLVTMIAGYFNRDDQIEDYLKMFNDNFPDRDPLSERFDKCLAYIDECGFSPKSRIWKRSDIFSALIQIDMALVANTAPDPLEAVQRIEQFFSQVDNEEQTVAATGCAAVGVYAKASLQASNDRINRVRRGVIFEAVLLGADADLALATQGLL